MNNRKDQDGNLFPDDVRLTRYGRIHCSTSLDELPELWNTLKGAETLADLLVVAKTADAPYTLEFYAMLENKPEQRIFDIRLSGKMEENMGVVRTENGEIFIDVTLYQFLPDAGWTKDEINTVLAMQETANEMLSKLGMEEDNSIQENQPAVQATAPVSSVVNMLSIQTPYGSLHYPVRWKDYLVT